MGEFFTLTPNDENQWNEFLSGIGTFDVYHLPNYHRLSEIAGEGSPVALVYRRQDLKVIFPLCIRKLDEVPYLSEIGSGWYDATSVYGYSGPLASRALLRDESKDFWKNVNKYCRDSRIVSIITSLHPLLNQRNVIDGFGTVIPTSPTISVDLTLPNDDQVRAYRSSFRQKIRQLGEKGCECFLDTEKVYWDQFVDIYLETMKRNCAPSYYFFNPEYFRFLKEEMSSYIDLFVCMWQGEVINAGISTICNGIIQAGLRGTRKDFLSWSPELLSMDTLRRWGVQRGAHTLHLGRGFEGKNDSLLHFKKGFSKREHSFKIWHYISDREVYRELVQRALEVTSIKPQKEYFPEYRNPEFDLNRFSRI